VLDRVRISASLSDIEVARRRATILTLIDSLELIEVDSTVLNRAAQPMPTELGTLDAIHLASALLWKDAMCIDPVLAPISTTRIPAADLLKRRSPVEFR